jgi:RNA polymerase sigma factor (TIGR02999 family)
MTHPSHNVTEMLQEWSNRGDRQALDELIPIVYEELRRQASLQLRHERPNHTLQTTALVHEAYLRLVDQRGARWQNRAHFFAIAAQMMRRILVDHMRKTSAAKRGGSALRLPLDEGLAVTDEQSIDLVAIDEALVKLSALDPQQGRIVELRFFGGLNVEETAEVLDISPRTVKRDWRMAKAWLHREIGGK